LLLSPAFFASEFVRREQLLDGKGEPHTRIRKPLVPVLLESLPLDGGADLAGLEQLQIFRGADGRSLGETAVRVGPDTPIRRCADRGDRSQARRPVAMSETIPPRFAARPRHPGGQP